MRISVFGKAGRPFGPCILSIHACMRTFTLTTVTKQVQWKDKRQWSQAVQSTRYTRTDVCLWQGEDAIEREVVVEVGRRILRYHQLAKKSLGIRPSHNWLGKRLPLNTPLTPTVRHGPRPKS